MVVKLKLHKFRQHNQKHRLHTTWEPTYWNGPSTAADIEWRPQDNKWKKNKKQTNWNRKQQKKNINNTKIYHRDKKIRSKKIHVNAKQPLGRWLNHSSEVIISELSLTTRNCRQNKLWLYTIIHCAVRIFTTLYCIYSSLTSECSKKGRWRE